MSDNYEYKKGVCIHCGRSLMCGEGVAHFKCSYKAHYDLEFYKAIHNAEAFNRLAAAAKERLDEYVDKYNKIREG